MSLFYDDGRMDVKVRDFDHKEPLAVEFPGNFSLLEGAIDAPWLLREFAGDGHRPDAWDGMVAAVSLVDEVNDHFAILPAQDHIQAARTLHSDVRGLSQRPDNLLDEAADEGVTGAVKLAENIERYIRYLPFFDLVEHGCWIGKEVFVKKRSLAKRAEGLPGDSVDQAPMSAPDRHTFALNLDIISSVCDHLARASTQEFTAKTVPGACA